MWKAGSTFLAYNEKDEFSRGSVNLVPTKISLWASRALSKPESALV